MNLATYKQLCLDKMKNESNKVIERDEEISAVAGYVRDYSTDKEFQHWCYKAYNLTQNAYNHAFNFYSVIYPKPQESKIEQIEWSINQYVFINKRWNYIWDKLLETNPKYIKARKDMRIQKKLDKINDMF
jgi:hypothetical protein